MYFCRWRNSIILTFFMKLFRIVAKVLPIIAKIISVLLPGPVSTVVNAINVK